MSSIMRKSLFYLIPLILLCIAACKKLETTSSSGSMVTMDDAASMIANSLSSNSNGFTTFAASASTSSQKIALNNIGCGVTAASGGDTVTPHSITGTQVAYNYNISNKINCNINNVADNITSTLTFSGSFNGPNLSSSNSGTCNLTIAGFTPASAVYSLNGEFKSTGSFKVKPDSAKTGTSAINIVVKHLVITKATGSTPCIITGGTATATITGNSPKGAFTFTGALVFNGNNAATLTIGSTVYTLNLLTGVIARK
jgi:hypothetical protein